MLDLYYLQCDIFPAVMLLLILFDMRRISQSSMPKQIMRILILLVTSIFLLDGLSWVHVGIQKPMIRGLLWVVNTGYFMISGPIAYCWFCYTFVSLYGPTPRRIRTLKLATIPCLVVMLLALLSPWTKALFYITEATEYQRGSLYLIQVITVYLYLVASSILALIQSKAQILEERRHVCYNMSYFGLVTLIGGAAQTLFEVNTVMPCIAIAILISYLGLLRQQFLFDGLTKLYSREQLDLYLDAVVKKPIHNKQRYLYMMDINNFKSINDTYGHVVGDQALVQVAQVIQSVFSQVDAFTARYGGDEFAVVLECEDEKCVIDLEKKIDKKLNIFNKKNASSYQLGLCIGYACYGSAQTSSLKTWIDCADQAMYKKKRDRADKMSRGG